MFDEIGKAAGTAVKSFFKGSEMPDSALDVEGIVNSAEDAKNRQIMVQAALTQISSEASTAEVIFKTINKINDRIANSRV